MESSFPRAATSTLWQYKWMFRWDCCRRQHECRHQGGGYCGFREYGGAAFLSMDNWSAKIIPELWMMDHAQLGSPVKREQVGELTILTPNLRQASIAK
jgi:hypothetical protein